MMHSKQEHSAVTQYVVNQDEFTVSQGSIKKRNKKLAVPFVTLGKPVHQYLSSAVLYVVATLK